MKEKNNNNKANKASEKNQKNKKNQSNSNLEISEEFNSRSNSRNEEDRK